MTVPRVIPPRVKEAALAEIAWLSLAEICMVTGFSENKIHELRRRGLLPGLVKIGGQWRMSREDFKRAQRLIIRHYEKR